MMPILLCAVVFLTACGSSTPAGPVSGTVTETFNVTTATLQPNGVMQYVSGTTPTIRVDQSGPLEARVSFAVVAGCEFTFSLNLPILLVGGNQVFSSSGAGPELTVACRPVRISC